MHNTPLFYLQPHKYWCTDIDTEAIKLKKNKYNTHTDKRGSIGSREKNALPRTALLSIERADLPKLYDMFKARDAKCDNANFR